MTKINYCKAEYDSNQNKQTNAALARRSEWALAEATEFQTVFENHTHSAHIWDDSGKQQAVTCQQSTGIIIDFDNENWKEVGILNVKTVQATLDEYETHIYSSQSNLKIKKGHEEDGKVERFHAYIPFENPIEYSTGKGDNEDKFNKVFNHLYTLFNGKIDGACKDLGRLAFPTGNSPDKFYHYSAGKLFDWESDAYLGKVESMQTQPVQTPVIASGKTITLDRKIRMAKDIKGRAQYLYVNEIDKKRPIYCPFCDDEESDGPSAFVSFNGSGIPFINCSHCRDVEGKGTYWLNDIETNMLMSKANGMVAFSPMKESGTCILYPDGILAKKEEKHIRTHFVNNDLFPPYDFDTYDIVRDFSSDELFISDPEITVPALNLYKAPSVLHTKEDPNITSNNFPTISHMLGHLFPVPDEREWFEQWLSEVVRRKRMRTAFLILGQVGTGKNIFFEQVVGNIIGKNNTVIVTNDLIKKEFNTYLREGVFYIFDEVAVDKKDRIQVKEKIKRYITNDSVPIEGKGSNSQNGYRMTGNCVFLSNNDIPMQIDDPDRRFNVIRTNNNNIINEPWYKQNLTPDIISELPAFVAYMKAKKVTIDVCNKTIDNDEKKRLQEVVKSTVFRFWEALRNCDIAFFLDNQTLVGQWDDPGRRLSFDAQNSVGNNAFEMQMQQWKKDGGIVFDEIKELVYRIWGDRPPVKISLTNPPPGFRHSTTTKFAMLKKHWVKFK